ncbi:MAG: serine/threonine protein kinase, partial [Planctomycetota bacterium]
MSEAQRFKAEELFHRAVDLPPEGRDEFVETHCADDPELRAELNRLLTYWGKHDVVTLSVIDRLDQAETELNSHSVGPYKLVESLGRGGFGHVYLAQQQHPVRREVALKIIKPGMDTKQVIARFEAERQALAMMNHPNIAKAFDAGATDTGKPYFVMELVRGTPITEYCDQHAASLRERLELFAQVCRGVQHAHQKGVIHRDIKPSNVLVTQHDRVRVPKIIDFGIAKATREPLTDGTFATGEYQFIGTPEYVSPEQVDTGSTTPRDVDTRSDIYSLGVLMYELLVGTTPLDSKTIGNATPAEIQQLICKHEPAIPSR